MPENSETIIPSVRDAIDKLTTELKRMRIAFETMHQRLEDLIDRDTCECSPGYTDVKRDMN